MNVSILLSGAAGMLLLALPWLLLAVSAWRAARSQNDYDDRPMTRVSKLTDERHVQVVESPAAIDDQPTAEPLGIMVAASPPEAPLAAASVLVDLDAPDADFAVEEGLSPAEQENLLRRGVERAKIDHDHARSARLSLELARLLLARSVRPEAAALLQSAVRAARQAKLPVIHAEARIELAGIAMEDGDLTSACEHWQMAKTMFHETGRRADQDRIADLMRRHRCPTDWVLTNF